MSSNLLAGLAPWPVTNFSEFGEVEAQKLTNVQKLTGSFLGRNWVAIPHVTHHDEADVTAFEERRKAYNSAHGAKLTIVPALVKALADALIAFPRFNASLTDDGESLQLKKYVNVGVAVDSPRGLLVPVVRHCDQKNVATISAEVIALSEKARVKGLSMSEMSGGCISLSSLGHIGGTAFTPIVNAPELAILGACRMKDVPARSGDGNIAWRRHLPLSLSYDHRVINGADAARFVRLIADRLDASDFFPPN